MVTRGKENDVWLHVTSAQSNQDCVTKKRENKRLKIKKRNNVNCGNKDTFSKFRVFFKSLKNRISTFFPNKKKSL